MTRSSAMRAVIIALSLISMPLWPALAQQAPTTRIRGTIDKVDGSSIVVKSRDGKLITMPFAKDLRVSIANRMTLADIKDNSFIGVAGVAEAGDVQRAVSIVIFPESSRGAGEGFRPYDMGANSTMTNATVALDPGTTAGGGRTITVKYRGGEKKILLTADTQVSTPMPGQISDLKAGAAIAASATVLDGEKLEATRITVGKDGFVPN